MQVRIATTRKPNGYFSSYPAFAPFRFFDEFYRELEGRTTQPEGDSWRPAVDIAEHEGNIIIYAELPGVAEKDIELKLDGNVLTIRGEKKRERDSASSTIRQSESFCGQFSRSFTIPETVDPEKISASYRNGVLVVTLPQKPEVKPRSIKVNS